MCNINLAHVVIYATIGYGIFWVGRWFKHKCAEQSRNKSESDWMKFVQKHIDNIRDRNNDDCIKNTDSDVDDNTIYVNKDGGIRGRQVPTNLDLD